MKTAASSDAKGTARPKKKVSAAAPLDNHRMEGPDPRDPRCKGPPCKGAHEPDPPGKGSLSGANQHGSWTTCRHCNYIPRAGAHARYWKAGPLSSDVKEVHQEISVDATAEEFPLDRDTSLAAAEVSARNQLEKVQALRKGAAPKVKNKAAQPTPVTEHATSETSSPLSPGTILINDTPLPAHPGRKATRMNQVTAENLEYESRDVRE